VIKAGWKREQCPQCRQPGRVYERLNRTLEKLGKNVTCYHSLSHLKDLGIEIHGDICDNCGVHYSYEAVAIEEAGVGQAAGRLDPDHRALGIARKLRQAELHSTDCKDCGAHEGSTHRQGCAAMAVQPIF
jgi:hypothetical protein